MANFVQFSPGACPCLKKINYHEKCGIFGSKKQNQMVLGFLEPFRKGTNYYIQTTAQNKINNGGLIRKREKEIIRWSRVIGCIDDGSCGMAPQFESSPSTIDLIIEFYKSINCKNTHNLERLLAQDCEFEDLVFYIPFEGKQEVLRFLHDVMDAMGHTVHFKVENITEGENFTTAVMWHLEWEGKALPFTTGYSFFECTEVDEKLFIRKIKGLEELPVKPGDLLLKLLKAATTVFDHFPIVAKGLLLKSPDTHEALRMLLDLLGADHDHGKS